MRGTTRVLVVLVGLAAVLLTGCSAQKLPISPADKVRAALVTTRLAGTAQVALDSRTVVLGQNVDVVGAGAFDPGDQSADVQIQIPMLGGPVHALLAGGIVYAQLPPAFAMFVPSAKPWVSVDLAKLAQQQFGVSLAQLGLGPSGNPFDQLAYLDAIKDARMVGQEQVTGRPTSHYAVTIDLSQTPAAKNPASKPAIDRVAAFTGSTLLPIDVWIDGDGKFRQVAQTVHGAPAGPGVPATDQTATVQFTSFGGPKPAPPPPPADVTDLSSLLPTG